MYQHPQSRRLSITRRGLLRIGGGLAAAATGARFLPGLAAGAGAAPAPAPLAAPNQVHLQLAGTDGWIFLPGSVGSVHPDPYAPGQSLVPVPAWARSTYIFGFRDVTGLTTSQVFDQKNKAQASAPMLWVDELDEVRITLTDLGLQQRPDLVDSHTIHWHGFRNATPIFDGVPEMSIAVPIGRDFTYFYRPREAGTYMYHCHFEDVEHVQMGMTGIIFVRPAQNKTPLRPGEKYVYNDVNGSTRYDREFGMFLSEVWADAHYRDAHIQVSDWSEYSPDLWLLNGRAYPDTLAPNGAGRDPTGDLLPTAGFERLQYQPISSLVTANGGDRVLLRFVNLGYTQAAMTLDGIPMTIVGKDATLLRGRDGTDLSYQTNTVYIGPGESVEGIFEAPRVTAPTTYLLYNRKLSYLANPALTGLGGQMTEIRISPAGTLAPQAAPQL